MTLKYPRLIFASCLIFWCLAYTAQSQTVDEIITRHLKARGGKEAVESINSIKITGKTSIVSGDTPFRLYYKKPNKYRMEVELMGKKIIQAFDGVNGWYVNPISNIDKPTDMPQEMLKSFRNQTNILETPLIDYKKRGIAITLAGKEKVGSSLCHKLKVTMKEGNQTIYMFIDTKTYLNMKNLSYMTMNSKEVKLEIIFKNYKKIGLMNIPHITETKMSGRDLGRLVFEKVEMNVNIEDSIFKKPN